MTEQKGSGRAVGERPLAVERLRLLSRELAWAAEETRQRLLVNDEHRDHSANEGWERLTEFQRDQWIRHAHTVLARLSVNEGGVAPPVDVQRLRIAYDAGRLAAGFEEALAQVNAVVMADTGEAGGVAPVEPQEPR